MKIDVVFEPEFDGSQRVFKRVAIQPGHVVIAEEQSDPLESSWCQRVVNCYLLDAAALTKDSPFPIGTRISAPIVIRNGEVYGMLR